MIRRSLRCASPLGPSPERAGRCSDASRRAGLHRRLGSPDAVRSTTAIRRRARPHTGILNPHGIAAVARDVTSAVDATLDASFPSCSAAISYCARTAPRTAPPGPLWPCLPGRPRRLPAPSDQPKGEVASLDLAVATARGPDLLTDLDGLRPLVRTRTSRSSATGSLTITTISSASTSGHRHHRR